jgi:hypothetical protein
MRLTLSGPGRAAGASARRRAPLELSGHQFRVAGMVAQGGSTGSSYPDAVGAAITALPGIMKVAYPPRWTCS